MTLETAAYINGLNASYPEGRSTRTETDDHLRLIKAALVATFPTISASVSVAHSALNTLVGVTSPINARIAQIDFWHGLTTGILPAVSASISVARVDITALAAALPLREVFRGSMTVSQSVYTFGTGTFGGANRLTVFLSGGSLDTGTMTFRAGDASGIMAAGYVGRSTQIRTADLSPIVRAPTAEAFQFVVDVGNTNDYFYLKIVLERVSGNEWIARMYGYRHLASYSSSVMETLFGTSYFTLPGEIDQLQFASSGVVMYGTPDVIVWAEDLP